MDSHTALFEHFQVPDSDGAYAVRLECTPPNDDVMNLDAWCLRVDETTMPRWYADVETTIRQNVEALLRRIVVRESRTFGLEDGVYVLGPGVRVPYVNRGRIIRMVGDSHIGLIDAGTVVERMDDRATMNTVNRHAIVRRMRGESHIENVFGEVEHMCDRSTIGDLFGGDVREMLNHACIGSVTLAARIGWMDEHASIGVLGGYGSSPECRSSCDD